MKYLFWVALVSFLIPVSASSQAVAPGASPSKEAHEVFSTLTKWGDALSRGDARSLGEIYSDELMVMAPDDTVRGRSDEMKNVRAGDPSNPIITFDDLKVRIFGNTAVVSGIQRRRSKLPGSARGPQTGNMNYRFSAVLVKHEDKWRMELLHLNRSK